MIMVQYISGSAVSGFVKSGIAVAGFAVSGLKILHLVDFWSCF